MAIRLESLRSNPEFRNQVKDYLEKQRQALKNGAWFQRANSNSPLNYGAYFSMEFGLSEALPIYSGGLNNVAGDHLKAASDLGVPIVAVGLLFQQGYFRQIIDADGSQHASYPYNDPGQKPIIPVRHHDGERRIPLQDAHIFLVPLDGSLLLVPNSCGPSVVSINKSTDALEFSEYRVGSSSPDERAFVGVVMSDVGVDLPH